jgi:glutamate dehydrogenase
MSLLSYRIKQALTSSITKEFYRNKSAKPRTIISDELSSTLNQLQHDLEVSDLYENMASRKNVLSRALPRTLIDKVGLEVLMQRLPEQVGLPSHARFVYPC